MFVFRFLLLIAAYCVIATPANAHSVSTSYLNITVDKEHSRAEWRVSLRDLNLVVPLAEAGTSNAPDSTILAKLPSVSAYAFDHIELRQPSGLCSPTEPKLEILDDDAVLRFNTGCPVTASEIAIRYDVLFDLDSKHIAYLNLSTGKTTHTGVFNNSRRTISVELDNYAWWSPLTHYPWEGIWHIFIGLDHILFLLVLLLPAVLRRSGSEWHAAEKLRPTLVSVIRIVTAFTIAHSITLSLAALQLVYLPPRLIESVIAASVVVAALNNLFPFVERRAWVLTFGFGLIHGFGFASVLQDLGLPGQQLVVALLGFNLGVEIGQLAIVAAIMPLAFALRRKDFYVLVILRAGSCLVIAVAALWLFERAFDVTLYEPLTPDWARFSVAGSLLIAGALVGVHFFRQSTGAASDAVANRSRLEALWSSHRAQLALAGSLTVAGIATLFYVPSLNESPLARAERWTKDWRAAQGHVGSRLVVQHRIKTGLAAAFSLGVGTSPAEIRAALDSRHSKELARGRQDAARQIEFQRALVAAVNPNTQPEAVETAKARTSDSIGSLEVQSLLQARAGNLKGALESVERALSLDRASATATPRQYAWLQRHRAAWLFESDRRAEAKEVLLGVLEKLSGSESIAASEPSLLAEINQRLARHWLDKKAWVEATPYAKRALELHQNLQDQENIAIDASRLADLYLAATDIAGAAKLYRQALSHYQAANHLQGQAQEHRNIAMTAQLAGDLSEAAKHYRRSFELNSELGDENGLAVDAARLATIYRRNGEINQAKTMLEQAIAVGEKLGDQRALASHYSRLGNLYLLEEQFDQAAPLYEKARRFGEIDGAPEDLANTYANLANLRRRAGDSHAARTLFEKSLNLYQQVGQRRKAQRVQRLIAKLEN